MKQLLQVILVAIVAIGTALTIILTSEPRTTASVNTQQEQPPREKYIAPEWVINERGQRCIKQGTTITCG